MSLHTPLVVDRIQDLERTVEELGRAVAELAADNGLLEEAIRAQYRLATDYRARIRELEAMVAAQAEPKQFPEG